MRGSGERSPEVHGQVSCARQDLRQEDAQSLRKRSGVPDSSGFESVSGLKALQDHPEATEEYMVARLQSVMRQASVRLNVFYYGL